MSCLYGNTVKQFRKSQRVFSRNHQGFLSGSFFKIWFFSELRLQSKEKFEMSIFFCIIWKAKLMCSRKVFWFLNNHFSFIFPNQHLYFTSNRLSSTIGGNREIHQLYTTSQVSNMTRKTKFPHISWHVFQD